MRITLIGQHYPPEPAAAGNRVAALARGFRALGHEVTVVTALPHYPDGVLAPGDRPWRLRAATEDGVRVLRSPVWPAANAGALRRGLDHLSFALSATVVAALGRRADVIVATSPPLFAGLAGRCVAALTRRPFVLDVRDLWPASIEAVGASASPRLLGALERLERGLYRAAAAVVVVSPAFVGALESRGIRIARLETITNGLDPVEEPPPERAARARARLGFDGRFGVLYLGTVGMAHGLEVMLDAAERAAGGDLAFAVVGDGAERARLEAEARRRGLARLRFVGAVPREQVAEMVAAADACLVHLKPHALFETVLPTKLFDAWGLARPVLLGVGGEARRLLEAAGGGVAFAPGDADALLGAIRELRAEPDRARQLGAAGRAHVERHYRRDALVERYARLLADVAGGSPS